MSELGKQSDGKDHVQYGYVGYCQHGKAHTLVCDMAHESAADRVYTAAIVAEAIYSGGYVERMPIEFVRNVKLEECTTECRAARELAEAAHKENER